ncbi:hypothetical protein CLU79DRAFT_497595 [Phycomyces nitens]|nr:hypothetical protein CLU79DRAFT_497595 [Phycomyces nitens]
MEAKSLSKLQRLARWPNSSPTHDAERRFTEHNSALAPANIILQQLDHNDLVQGSLYILKISLIVVGLFQGWDDDMCCFVILRSDVASMRWSEARYIPGDFAAFDAFDSNGNPSVFLWTRQLRAPIPNNWFALFEEARRKQREWSNKLQHHELPVFPTVPALQNSAESSESVEYITLTDNPVPPLGTKKSSQKIQKKQSLPKPQHQPQPQTSHFSAGHILDTQPESDPSQQPIPHHFSYDQNDTIQPYITHLRGFPSLSSSSDGSFTPLQELARHQLQYDAHTALSGPKAGESPDLPSTQYTSSIEGTMATKEAPAAASSTSAFYQLAMIGQSPIDLDPMASPPRDSSIFHYHHNNNAVSSLIDASQKPTFNVSLFDNDITFPHDADRFSIHTGEYQSSLRSHSPSPSLENTPSTANNRVNRKSVKRLFRIK